MAARSRLLQRFFRRGDDGAVYFVLEPVHDRPSEKTAHLLDRASYHWRRGEYDHALQHAEAATKLDPESEIASIVLACYAIEAERYEILDHLYQRMPEEQKHQMPFIALRAVLLAATENLASAQQLLSTLVSRHQNNSFFLYAKAEVLRLTKQWGIAAEQYRTLYTFQRDFPYGHFHAAQVLIAMGQYHQAIEYLELRLRAQPRHAEIYHWLGLSFEALGETQKALQAYREALSIQPDRYLTHYRLGRLERTIGHHAAALQHLRIAFFHLPEEVAVRRELVHVLIAVEQWEEAARLLPDIIRSEPTRSDIEMLLVVFPNVKDHQELEQCIEERSNLVPSDFFVWYARGRIYQQQQRYLEAKAALEESVRLHPSVEAYNALGDVLAELGDIGAAIECYTATLQIDGKNHHAWRERSKLQLRSKQPDHALADIDQALMLDPDDAQLHVLRAQCFIELGKEQEALDDLILAVQREPANTEAWLLSSQLWRKRGEYAQAIYALKQVLKTFPDDIAAHTAMAETQLALGRFNAAKQHIEQILKLRPDLGEQLFLSLGKSLEARNLYSRALELYEEAIKHYPESPDLRFRYGYIALKNGSLQLCSQQLEALMSLDPIRAATLRDVYSAFYQSRRAR